MTVLLACFSVWDKLLDAIIHDLREPAPELVGIRFCLVVNRSPRFIYVGLELGDVLVCLVPQWDRSWFLLDLPGVDEAVDKYMTVVGYAWSHSDVGNQSVVVCYKQVQSVSTVVCWFGNHLRKAILAE